MHITDWYATYCILAGISPKDAAGEAAGIPPIDSLDVWPMVSGANLTSPRQELFMSSSCLIQGDWKLITGKVSSASWAGPTYPNTSTAATNNTLDKYTADCRAGCLYNVGVEGDMTEHEDLARAEPDRLHAMLARLEQLKSTVWAA